MPTTAGTVTPIAPAPGARGVAAVPMATIPCDPGIAFLQGDIIVIDATTRDADLSATPVAAAGTVFGVALTRSFTANATINRDGNVTQAGTPGATRNGDLINIALATADSRFAGNLVGAAGTADYTGVYATSLRLKLGLIRTDAPSNTVMAIDSASGGVDVVFPLEYVTPQFDTVGLDWQYGRTAGVGITNPRVLFMFLYNATVFGIAIA